MNRLKISILSIIFIISSAFLTSCGFTIDDLLYDYNTKFDKTPILKFLDDNGKVNPEAIIQEEKYGVEKLTEGGQSIILTGPEECESFQWTLFELVKDKKTGELKEGKVINVIPNTERTFVVPVDKMATGSYKVKAKAFYKGDEHNDSCLVEIF